jgi:pimeloyl-ACP methyl ester carboxylesterase
MFRVHAEVVVADGSRPSQFALVLHGIFGAGKNWLSFLRRLAAKRPDWGFVLPDLRGHGQSLGAPAPHDLRAAARDLSALASELRVGPIRAVIGHSFGGKVALAYGAEQDVDQVWLLDSSPGASVETASSPTMRVLTMLEGMPACFAYRGDFTREVERQGFAPEIGAWLAMSLCRCDDGFALGLDLPAIRDLLNAYFEEDSWAELDKSDRTTHVVVADKSSVWQPGDHARLDRLRAMNPRVELHRLANAGHWLHVDEPDALRQLMSDRL